MQWKRRLSLRTRFGRLQIARVAIFALVLNAWAPTVTALVAFASGRPVALPEHCLAMALEHAQSDPAKSTDPERDRGFSCPFCFAHAGSFALAPIVHVPKLAVAVPEWVVASRLPAGIPSAPWLDPKPRGPPVLS
jgi:hypothetical protein